MRAGLMDLARRKLADNQWSEALKICDAMRRQAPADADATLCSASIHMGVNHAELAEPLYRELLQRDASNFKALWLLNESLKTQQRLAESLPPVDAYVALHPGEAAGYELRATIHMALKNDAGAIADGARACGLGNARFCS